MPKAPHEIHPFNVSGLGTLLIKEFVCAGKGLIQQLA